MVTARDTETIRSSRLFLSDYSVVERVITRARERIASREETPRVGSREDPGDPAN